MVFFNRKILNIKKNYRFWYRAKKGVDISPYGCWVPPPVSVESETQRATTEGLVSTEGHNRGPNIKTSLPHNRDKDVNVMMDPPFNSLGVCTSAHTQASRCPEGRREL